MAIRQVRPIRVEGNIAYVPLTKGYEAIIDASNVSLIDKWNWVALTVYRKNGSIRCVYGWRNTPRGVGKRRPIYLHREILGIAHGILCDHIDGNGLNNCKANLRVATHSENQRNGRLSSRNSSGVKGVYWNRANRNWVAQIRANGKCINLGSFSNIEMAAKSYAEASRKYHGDFGRIG